MRTVVWVMSLALVGLLFDGYDLVVYGACVSTFLRDPTQLGVVTPAIAGQLGSYALFGVLGRLGGVGGPLLGGYLAGGGFALETIFYILTSVAVLGSVLTILVPSSKNNRRLLPSIPFAQSLLPQHGRNALNGRHGR